jgi:hypothetical protein
MESSKSNNGWWKSIVVGIITVSLSIGGSIYTSGQTNGRQAEKVESLEKKYDKIEVLVQQDHDLLTMMNQRLINVENMLKEMKEK